MKALVLSRKGGKAIVLLPGGEMRTVRAQKTWQVGMEVSVRSAPPRKFPGRSSFRAASLPAAVCIAAVMLVFVGLNMLGGNHIDRQHPLQPMTSGSIPAPTDESQSLPTETPVPTATPQPIAPTPEAIPASREVCDECGQVGHDDDDCPYERCDECGQVGHDDDDCPYERCDECGQPGHDDDNCPQRKNHHGEHHND